jgi:polysaccharide biosynthesis protein PelF
MDIALIAEGGYPFHPGGVSVWCDQLIRGMSPHRFELFAIGGGTEKVSWDLPENVSGTVNVRLWGSDRGASRVRRDGAFAGVFQRFVATLVEPQQPSRFLDSLRELFEYAQRGELRTRLRSDTCVEILLDAVSGVVPTDRFTVSPPPVATVADAVGALDLLEHYLRPLSAPPPRADLCHASANGLSTLIALSGHWTHETPFLLTEHGLYLRERYLALRAGANSHVMRWVILRFFKELTSAAYDLATIIAPGSEYNRQWEEVNGAEPSRIRPIHNGVDIDSFPLNDQEPSVPTLTWVGRIDPLKDVETLLLAFAEVRRQIPEARLRIFGPTPRGNDAYLGRCLQLHQDLDLGSSATFEGPVPSVVTAYHAGHVVVMTSISEGFPYVLIEAMAAGRATVSTEVGGCPEAVGDAGLLVPPRDPSAVASACIQLLSDSAQRRAMGLAAHRRILSQFTVEQCLALYSDLYREITSLPVSASVVKAHQDQDAEHDTASAPIHQAVASYSPPRLSLIRESRMA